MNRFWKRNYVLHESNPNMVITTREIGDIPGITPANDIFSFEEGYLVIKNPSVRQRNYYAD